MLYTLNLDSENYILSISHTPNDNINIDIDQIEAKYLNAYKYNGELFLDEEKKQAMIEEETQKAKETEIAELKKSLNDTDYIMAETFEEIMSLDNALTFIADFIAILKQFKSQYSETIANRKAWRQRIKELSK